MQSYAVADPLITEVMDLVTGQVIPVSEAIGSGYDKAIQQHLKLREAKDAGAPRSMLLLIVASRTNDCFRGSANRDRVNALRI